MSFSERRGFFLALKAWLHAEKITTLQGPLEFSTWHPYRFVCERADSPWFAGEQPMPDYHYKDFLSGGFSQGPQYESTWVGNLAQSLVIGKKLGVERGLANLQIETVRGHEIVDWLPRLHKLSTQTFQGNYGYSEIDCTEFCELYASVVAMNAAVVLASDTEGPIGMAFSYAIGQYNPDPNQPGRSCSVLKSLGTHPRARKRGIGFAVSYLTHRLWLEQGCEAIIHAYMMSNNVSRSMSAHFGSCLRRYALVKWTTE